MAPTGTTTTTTAAFAQLTTYTWSGSQSTWARTNVYGDGEMLATYDSVGAGLHFHLTDHLGTRRVQTDPTGTPETDCQSLPYGDSQYCFAAPGSGATGASDDDATPLHFTGKQRDVESGNDYFEARYYASNAGRFMSPDWSATVEPVPYARMDSPQSLNLYAYVGNNPLGSADPDGHRQPNLTDRFGCSDGEYCDGNSGQPYDSLTTAVRDAAAIGGTPFDGAMEFLGALYSANQAQQNADSQRVGNTTTGALAGVLTNEDSSLSTPKGGDPQQLATGMTALANAIYNNATQPNIQVVAPTGTPLPVDAQVMRGVVDSRTHGGADPVQGRRYYGTSHTPPSRLHSRPAGNHLKGAAGRETVFASFGPFHDSIGHGKQTWIYIYNNPGH